MLHEHRKTFPICPKCNLTCNNSDDSFVRAFNQVYHYKCFVCEDCLVPVADKYYPIQNQSQRRKKAVLCEHHYLKRSGSICPKCSKPITSNHHECSTLSNSTCSSCVTPTTTHQYEHRGATYCRFHYSLIPETHCSGCNQAILKQFVEHRDLPHQIWHPECYMIFKFWGVKLAPATKQESNEQDLILVQNQIDKKVTRVWTDLSSFEESSANCISDMLLNVAAGAYVEGIRMANQFIMHLQVLFNALDTLEQAASNQDLHCNTEANLICKQMIRFFQLLTTPPNESPITQELLSLITGLAQNLKKLIKIGLSTALNLEHEHDIQNAIPLFLSQLLQLEKKRVWIAGRYWFKDSPPIAVIEGDRTSKEECVHCQLVIQDTHCYQHSPFKWHPDCFRCITCSCLLNEHTARLVSSVLYCPSCCKSDVFVACTYVSFLQQSLHHLKLYLAKVSTSSSLCLEIDKKEQSSVLMPQTKRQKSILRLLGTRSQQQSRMNSVNLGQVGRTSSTTLPGSSSTSSYTNKKQSNLMISTSQQPELAALSSPASPVVQHSLLASPNSPKGGLGVGGGGGGGGSSSKLAQNLRRTFSTNSNSSIRRSSLYNVFARKKEPRRASVLTIDESGHASHKYVQLSTLTPSQDFVVRHAAVITIQPFFQNSYSLDQLVDLIDEKKKKKKSKSSNNTTTAHPYNNTASALWGKLITHIKTSHSTTTAATTSASDSSTKESRTFGVALDKVAQRDHDLMLKQQQQDRGITLRDFVPALAASFSDNALIPTFVKSCILIMLQSDMSVEGVFRKNGNIRQLRVLSESIDRVNVTTLPAMEQLLSNENSIQLAALLKRYLRELPEPLLTFSLYNLFVQCGRMMEEEGRKKVLHLACCLLPKPNRDTLIILFCCLKWVSTFSDTNKMDIPNLARVIAPSVLFDRSSGTTTNAADLRQGAQEEINVIETLIRNVEEMSTIPSDLTLFTLHNIHQDMSDLNSRYFVRHYQQLLQESNDRRRSKSENNSPMSPAAPRKLMSPSLLLRHTMDSSSHSTVTTVTVGNFNSVSHTPPPPSKQRRTSWIPGLAKR